MLNIFYKTYKILPSSERRKFLHLQILVVLVALIDAAGVASILPFMTLLTDVDVIRSSIYMHNIYSFTTRFGVENDKDFLILAGFSVLIILSLGILFKGIVTYLQFKFVYMQEHTLGSQLFKIYLAKPYNFFSIRNSAELTKNLVSELNIVINQVFMPLINLVSQVIATSSIICVLLIVNFKPTLVLLTGFLMIYLILFFSIKNILKKLGESRFLNNERRFKLVNDSFRNIRELKILNVADYFSQKFYNYSYSYAATQTSANLWSQIPRFFLEFIVFGGIILFVINLLINNNSISEFIPIISIYVFAAYRLLPSIQHIYGCVTVLRFSSNSLNYLHSELNNISVSERRLNGVENIIFEDKIELRNISVSHTNKTKPVLSNVNLVVKKYSHIGVVGKSGCGKSTLLDVISGLVLPDVGLIEVDGKPLTIYGSPTWYRLLGYVAQDVYLADIPLSENIALGQPKHEINYQKLHQVCEMVGLTDFIETELYNKYDTLVGENGSRLSGGQRQRVSIARALYRSPQILILDEATSSLDKEAEQNLVRLIDRLKENTTIISVAHNEGALVNCDEVYRISNGRLHRIVAKNP